MLDDVNGLHSSIGVEVIVATGERCVNDVGPEDLYEFARPGDQKDKELAVSRGTGRTVCDPAWRPQDRKAHPASYMATARAHPASLRLPRHYYDSVGEICQDNRLTRLPA